MAKEFLGAGWKFPIELDKGGIGLSTYDENIQESIRIILETAKGERQMRPDFGCDLNTLVFAENTLSTAGRAAYYVEQALVHWEPRIELIRVEAKPDREVENRLAINIEYRLIATNTIFNLVYPFYLTEGGVMKEAPKIESRIAQDFVKEIRRLIPHELPNWLRGEEHDWPDGDPGVALVEIFARFMAIVSERLSRVPEKNFLAFLEMIGVSLRAPKAARVPVRFFLSKGSTEEAVVPQGAPLAATGAEPQAFETEKALTVMPAALVEVITYDPSADQYTKHDVVAKPDSQFMCFKGTEGIEHTLISNRTRCSGSNTKPR